VPNPSQHRQHPVLAVLGDTIRHIRIRQGISQEKLALIAEIDRSYVGRVERDDNNVTILALLKLAGALDISLAQLMQEAEL
jgi:transcriptional regulator with XRE-family HTH domain